MKRCSKCNSIPSFNNFHKDKSKSDGLRPRCKTCRSSEAKGYYEINKSRINFISSVWNSNNKEMYQETNKRYRMLNKERIKLRSRSYYLEHKSEYSARTALRRSRKLKRTPEWLTSIDSALVKSLYNSAKRLSECIGIKFHVDHIIPLQGELVSGLHTPSNLRIISSFSNLSKGNKYNPEVSHS